MVWTSEALHVTLGTTCSRVISIGRRSVAQHGHASESRPSGDCMCFVILEHGRFIRNTCRRRYLALPLAQWACHVIDGVLADQTHVSSAEKCNTNGMPGPRYRDGASDVGA